MLGKRGNDKMKVLIVDDDVILRKLLRYFIGSLFKYKIVGEVVNGEELIYYVMKEKLDFVLVDIGMFLLNGMEVVKVCKEFFLIL